MRAIAIAVVALSAGFATNCKKPAATPPTATPAGEMSPPTAVSAPTLSPEDPTDDPARGNINIDDAIKKACGITDSEAFFAFDSANVRPQDRAVLKKLADCFTTGPLAGREMRLVGHADPRGSEEYNRSLGNQRAENVRRVIVEEGLAAAKAVATSRGEDDAKGTDEASWAEDRRVDVVLGD